MAEDFSILHALTVIDFCYSAGFSDSVSDMSRRQSVHTHGEYDYQCYFILFSNYFSVSVKGCGFFVFNYLEFR